MNSSEFFQKFWKPNFLTLKLEAMGLHLKIAWEFLEAISCFKGLYPRQSELILIADRHPVGWIGNGHENVQCDRGSHFRITTC